jgi:hypothetical protein
MIQKFRKKPVVIEAVQFTEEMLVRYLDENEPMPEGLYFRNAERDPQRKIVRYRVTVGTIEGDDMTVTFGDWIITGVKGEHYPCKPDVFALTYEPA